MRPTLRGEATRFQPQLSCDDPDGCCLCAKLRGFWRPWATAKRDFAVRMGRHFAASGACVARTWPNQYIMAPAGPQKKRCAAASQGLNIDCLGPSGLGSEVQNRA